MKSSAYVKYITINYSSPPIYVKYITINDSSFPVYIKYTTINNCSLLCEGHDFSTIVDFILSTTQN